MPCRPERAPTEWRRALLADPARSIALAVIPVLAAAQAGSIHLQVVASWASQVVLYTLMWLEIVGICRWPGLTEGTRRFWSTVRVMGLLSIPTVGIQLVVTLRAHGDGGVVPGLFHSVLSAITVLLLSWACLTFRGSDDQQRRLRRWLDAASLMVGALGAMWYFESGPLLSSRVGGVNTVAIIVMEAVALVCVLAVLQPMTNDIRPIVRRTGLLVVGAVTAGVAAEAALPLALHGPWLRLVLLVRIGCPALAFCAIRHQRLAITRPPTSTPRPRRLYSRFPYAAVVVTYALLALALSKAATDGRIWGMFIAACAVTTLVLVRQMNALGDNARLVHDLTASINRSDELAAELHQHAFYDHLTGLPNRVLFTDRLTHALAARSRTAADIAVMVVDLDDFKAVNDRSGHAEGDRVLREAADRLSSTLRAGDTVARLGGDEFAILINDADTAAVLAVAARIVAAFQQPFILPDQVAELGVSVGLTMTDAEDLDGQALLLHADVAMYEAKSSGKCRYEVFVPSMLDNLLRRHDTKQALTRAIEENELVVHYQPIVDAGDGHVRGVEALVRWVRPGHGMLPPLEFLTLAEQVGFIADIDFFVMRQACEQVARWNADRDPGERFTLHVNMSAVTLAAPDVVSNVAAALRDSRLDAGYLTVELTETALVADPALVIARMNALKGTGVRLAIDDFGTGYSSLAYLRDLPVDTIKVDKSFVDRIVGEDVDRELVRTIISMAGRLGLNTVAEGVETQEQAELLTAFGCARMQGFLFARPTPADELVATGERIGRAARCLRQAAVGEPTGSAKVTVPSPR